MCKSSRVELVSADVVAHHVPPPLAQDSQGWKAVVGLVLGAFPDPDIAVDDLATEGDRVMLRYSLRGTHRGGLMGVPPTGKSVTFTGMIFDRLAGGKIVEIGSRLT